MAIATNLIAQQPNETLPGFKAENVLEAHGIDNVSPFSGDPGVVIPIGPEYSLSSAYKWQLKAYYSVKFWNLTGLEPPTCSLTETIPYAFVLGDPTVGVGWSLQLGYVVYSQFDPIGPWIYFSPEGGRHGVGGPGGVTSDGSHLRISAVGGTPQSPTYYTVESPDGTKQFFEQLFLPPSPASGTSRDFSNLTAYELFHGTPAYRYGLTRVEDRFGNTVIEVKYDNTQAWQATRLILNPDTNHQGPTVVLHWAATGGATVSWWVVDYALFPAVGSSQRKVSFVYQLSSFLRNPFDISDSQLNPCEHSPPTVSDAPLLQTLTFADNNTGSPSFTSFSYGFQYVGDGTLQKITLPTTGSIEYTYDHTTGTLCQLQPGVDPDSCPSGSSPTPNLPSSALHFIRYLDNSSAVVSRKETDSTTGESGTTSFSRRLIIQCIDDICKDIDDSTIYRRVTVIAPGNDPATPAPPAPIGPPSGPAQFATRSYHKVGLPGSVSLAAGIEVDRRLYAAESDSGTPVRTLIRCYGHSGPSCGFRTSAGALQQQDTSFVEPPQAEVTWYGAVPTGLDGGACGANPSCTESKNTPASYNTTVGQYGENVVRSTLSGLPANWSRTSTTAWNPQTGSKWMLDLFTNKSASEATAPAPSPVQTDYSFDLSNGFLISTSVTDGTYGNRSEAFTAGARGNAVGRTQSSSAGGMSTSSFGDTLTYPVQEGIGKSGGLPTGVQRSPFTWKSFDVDRDPSTGLITQSRDPNYATGAGYNSLKTDYGYDALGRLTSITPGWGDAPTVISYDSTTQTTVSRTGSDGNTTWQRYNYDGLGRLSREIRAIPTSSGGFAVRTHAYDNAGHAIFVSEWASCSNMTTDCLSATPTGTTSSNFDPLGRPRLLTRADGTQTSIDRTDTDGSILFSDSVESVTVNVGGADTTTKTRRDALGRIIAVTEPPVAGSSQNPTTNYVYNVLDKLAQVTQQDDNSPSTTQTRTFTYDAHGFLRQEATPEKTVAYNTYDALGNVLSETEQSESLNVLRTFDTAGRLQKVSAGNSGENVYSRNCYDGQTSPNCIDGGSGIPGFAGGSYPLGRLTQTVGYNPLSSPAATVTQNLTYSDVAGRLSARTTSFAASGSAFGPIPNEAWGYNKLGLVSLYTHPSGLTETTAYTVGLPTGVLAGAQSVVSGVTYQPAGTIGSYTTGSGANSVTTTVGIDSTTNMPRPSSISVLRSGNNLFNSGNYGYDGVGNILYIGPDTFGYDSRSRLTSAQLFDDATFGTLGSQSFTYDRFGNLIQKNNLAFLTSLSSNQLTFGTYHRGNLTNWGCEVLTYDGLDRQIHEASNGYDRTYLFDAAGERIVKVASGNTYTLRDTSNRVATEFSDTLVWRDNIHLGNLLVGSYVSLPFGSEAVGWQFYASDHVGTPRVVTDLSGNVLEGLKYWPYGDEVRPPATTSQRLRFAAMERDPESNHYYDHARNEDFNLGRFLSADPLIDSGRAIASPADWNRYAYTHNNPLRFVDPFGKQEEAYGYIFGMLLAKDGGPEIEARVRAGFEGQHQLEGAFGAAVGLGFLGAAALPSVAAAATPEALAAGAGGSGALATRLGRAGESFFGLVEGAKRTIESVTGAAFRRPDFLDSRMLLEVKNAARVGLSKQIFDFLHFAEANSIKFVLAVDNATRVSGNIQQLVDAGRIILVRVALRPVQ